MPINSLQTVAIVEQKNLLLPLVDNHTAKETVQRLEEPIAFFLVKMHQPIGAFIRELVAIPDERRLHFWIDETLAGEQEHNVSGLIEEGLFGCKRSLLRD